MYLTQSIKTNAQTNRHGIATICGERRQSWGSFAERVARLAGALRDLGVGAGDRVAILALNCDRYLEYYYACFWGGSVVVPMNLRWSAAENAYSLNDSGAQTIFIDDAFQPVMASILEQAKGVVNLIYMGDGETPEGWLNYEELIAMSAPAEDAGLGGEDLAGIFYTGGTTGYPKGVMLPHRGLWSSSVGVAYGFKFDSATKYLHAAPMFHLADGASSMGAVIAGGSHFFIPAFDAAKTIAAIDAHGVTDTLLVPTMVKMILDSPALEDSGLASLRQIFYGGSPMPEGVIRECLERLPHIGFTQAYGQTELSPLCTLNPPEYHTFDGPKAGKLRSVGRAALCNEIKIVDGDGNEVARGEVGEIVAKGANTMLGYWNLPEQTAAALKDGWVHTGDGAYMDEDGFIFIADRLKDMIISGGENIFSAEVESAISRHPGVSEVAVIGIPSDAWGESVHAIVIRRDGEDVSEDSIIDHTRALIAHYKCPRSVEFRSDPMPLSGAGKVLKRDLRAPFWQGRERQVN
ncbi:MAG: long-chain-fatty-acid--CoA ligase [Alphaproteobacteria bacterium]|nr:long-chain-fatty-acid--CoA ligase [Alphaproteobacteria bacterium]